MRVLLIDQETMFCDFALRCSAADHDVRWFKEPSHGKVPRDGEGFKGIEFIDDWRESMKWARDGLIVTSGNCKYMHELDRFRELGYEIFAPTVASAKLEVDRAAGMKAMEAAGIELPPYKMFDSLEAALRYARKAHDCLVFKTMGDENDKSLSFVSCNPAEMVGWIQQKIDRGMVLKGPCMLQDKIDMLAEVGVSGWFGPDGFLPDKWQVCFEHKKLMPGEIGPNTGEQGTVCQYTDTDKLANEMLVPMVGALRAAGHLGDFAIGAGIDAQGRAWPFEFTARLGWPAFFLQMASHKGDPAQWMRDLLDGKDSLRVSPDVSIGVVLAQPNYPYNKSPSELVEGNPVYGLDDGWDAVHPISVMVGKGVKMEGSVIVEGRTHETCGEMVAVATGLGKTVSKAMKKVYATIDEIKFPNMIYRNDIGAKLESQLPKLHKFGYAESMEF